MLSPTSFPIPATSHALDRPLRSLVGDRAQSTGGVRRLVYSEAETIPALVDEIVEALLIGEQPTILTDVAERIANAAVTATRAHGRCVYPPSCAGTRPQGLVVRRSSDTGGSLAWPTRRPRSTSTRPLFVLTEEQGRRSSRASDRWFWLAADGSTEDELRRAALQPASENRRRGSTPRKRSSPTAVEQLVGRTAARPHLNHSLCGAPARGSADPRPEGDPGSRLLHVVIGHWISASSARRSQARAPRQTPAIMNGIETWAATQNRSN